MVDFTIETQYDLLKEHYDKTLNRDTNLVETSNDVPTPITCIEEMVGKIPEKVWKNATLRILDPCCGCGNFFFVIYNKLVRYHSPQHILENMLYFNDINDNRLNQVRKIFGIKDYKLNIFRRSFLDFTPDDQGMYDIVVANPPYAKLMDNGKRASKNHNLIGVFINKTLEILNPNGLLLYITPDNWMSCADRNEIITTLTTLRIIHLNIHTAKRYFPGVGSSFTWYLVQKSKPTKHIEVSGTWNKQEYTSKIPSGPRTYIPLYYTNLVHSILSKTIDNAELPKYKVETSSDLHKYTKKALISSTENGEYQHRLIHTPSQTVYASRPHKWQDGYKVFIGLTSYYNIFVDNCGMTQSIGFIRMPSPEEAESTCEVLKHPIYKFINNICRWGNFNNVRILQKFPKYEGELEQIYDFFGITEAEKQIINA